MRKVVARFSLGLSASSICTRSRSTPSSSAIACGSGSGVSSLSMWEQQQQQQPRRHSTAKTTATAMMTVIALLVSRFANLLVSAGTGWGTVRGVREHSEPEMRGARTWPTTSATRENAYAKESGRGIRQGGILWCGRASRNISNCLRAVQ